MKNSTAIQPSLDDLASTVVGLGRELSQAAHAIHAGGNGRDFGFVARTLARLAERDAFDARDTASLDALRGILDADLRSEIVGSDWRVVETHYDENGAQEEIGECPVYSERGEKLLRVHHIYERFIAARNEALDRIAAERALLRLLRN